MEILIFDEQISKDPKKSDNMFCWRGCLETDTFTLLVGVQGGATAR